MKYARDLPAAMAPEQVPDVEAHIRAHLSSVCTEDDNPETLADQVRLSYQVDNGVLLITGELDAEPVAPYLCDDWTPEQDIEVNPLSVPSIEDES